MKPTPNNIKLKTNKIKNSSKRRGLNKVGD